MRYDNICGSYSQKMGVISLPPNPPLSTSLSHLSFNKICPMDGGNYIPLLMVDRIVNSINCDKVLVDYILNKL